MTPPLDIPELVRRKAEIHGASEWLVELPAIVADLERRWEFTAGKVIAGGTEAYVCETTRRDGTDAVLKVIVPREGGDEAHGAMLLERLGPSLHDLGLPVRGVTRSCATQRSDSGARLPTNTRSRPERRRRRG